MKLSCLPVKVKANATNTVIYLVNFRLFEFQWSLATNKLTNFSRYNNLTYLKLKEIKTYQNRLTIQWKVKKYFKISIKGYKNLL